VNRRIATVTTRLLLAAACLVALAGLVAACKQQEGDRCQIDTDCETPLICNQGTATCANPNSNEPIDANTPDFLDSPLDPDAPIDAPDDVMPDV
jgi:hypothetical protein